MSVFALALIVSTLVGLVAGVLPGVSGIRDSTYTAVRAGSRATDAQHRVTRRALVVTQVALAFVLLTSTGLLLRSVEKLLATEPGFDAQHVLTMQVVATGRSYGSAADLAQFYERALDAVRAVPGVAAAALTSQLPLSGDSDSYGVVFESDTRGEQRNAGAALRYVVTPDWFATMRIPLLEGRLLGAEDEPGAPQSALINASFARRRFGSQSPIGQRLRMGPYIGSSDGPWATVVGVVGDVKQTTLGRESPDAVYFAMGQWLWVDSCSRSRSARAPIPRRSRRASSVRSGPSMPTPPLVRVATMIQMLEASEAQRRFALVIFGAFALTAVVLAVVGLYGVVARSVEERKRELGVRAALGASPGRVAALVIRQGMTLAGAGIVVGVLGSAAATRALSSLLFGVSPSRRARVRRDDRGARWRVVARVRRAGGACRASRSRYHAAR